MLKAFKTEIDPTDEQKAKINKTMGTCRFVYNFYLAHNKELHYMFRERLIRKCREHGIEVGIADRFFASSKTCHSCGHDSIEDAVASLTRNGFEVSK